MDWKNLSKILKTINGDAHFLLEEKYKDEVEANKDNSIPISTEVKNIDINIKNIKWKKINEKEL